VDAKYRDLTNNTEAFIETYVYFDDVDVVYDLECDLTEFKGQSSMVINFESLDFHVTIRRKHEDGIIVTTMASANIGAPKAISITNFPNNPYTQLIAYEMKQANSKTKLYSQLQEAFKAWTNLQKFLQKSCEEIKFPEICYTCP
jgi:hypothetical protein